MAFDDDGYLKPRINDDKCGGCCICDTVCPTLNPEYNNEQPEFYAVWAADEIRKCSTSGGAFTLIAEVILKEGGVVFGAKWTEGLNVEIKEISSMKDIDELRHSKYVQSNAGKSFRSAKEYLEKGTRVFYSGLPCQIAGLKKYLKKDYENLITADIVCGGVPSIKMLHSYVSEFSPIEAVSRIGFRDEGDWDPHKHRIYYKDGTQESRNRWKGDPFQKAYHTAIMDNDVCKFCLFSRFPRQGDYSIGDFWGIGKINPEYDDKIGTSLIMVNSTKGKKLLTKVKSTAKLFEPIPTDVAAETPNRLNTVEATYYPPQFQRRLFSEKLKHVPFSDALKYASGEKFDVGIVTALSYNYGGNLTYYALYTYLKNSGRFSFFIDRRCDAPAPPPNEPMRMFEVPPYPEISFAKRSADYTEIRKNNEICDIFLLGSDQMLHPNFIRKFGYHTCLDWVYGGKLKIAYSSSFGQDTFIADEELKSVSKELFHRFDAVSMREFSGVDLMKEFGIEATMSLDPVFLCPKKDYLHLAKGGKIDFGKNHLGAYILDPNEDIANVLKRISEITGLDAKIIGDPYVPKKKYENFGISTLSDAKVEDWLNNIINCEYFVTDSYHGACFALIFNKPFTLIVNKTRGKTRVHTLSTIFPIEDRIIEEGTVNESDVLKEIDYELINSIISENVKMSKAWLDSTLNIKKDGAPFDSWDDRLNKVIACSHLKYSEIKNKILQREMDDDLASTIFRVCYDRSYEKTAEYGYLLGLMHRDGIGTKKDLRSAIEWMRKAAEDGSSWARTEHIALLMKSTEPSDHTLAFKYCKRYIDGGASNLGVRMALMYRDGIGTKKDLRSAIEWMRKAAEDGSSWARTEHITLLMKSAEPSDHAIAFMYCKKYIDEGATNLDGKMALMYRDGIGTKKDLRSAIEWMGRAAENGSSWARTEHITLLMKSAEPSDHALAFMYCKKYIDEGATNLDGKMALMYRDGIGTEKDLPSVIEWMGRAAENGSSWARAELELYNFSFSSNFKSNIKKYSGSKYAMIMNPYDEYKPLETLGWNTGNIAFFSAIDRLFSPDIVPYNYREIGVDLEKYDAVLMTNLIYIRENQDFSKLYNAIKDLDAKFVPMSVGLQSKTNDINFKLHESVIKTLKKIEKGSVIGVRGEYTKSVLEKNGITNTEIIGCPSMYYWGDRNLKISDKEHEKIIACCNFRTFSKTGHPVLGKELDLLTYFMDNDVQFIEQTAEKITKSVIDHAYFEKLKSYLDKRKMFFSNECWLDELRKYNFSFGMRFHSNVMALRAGVKSLFITHDSRTKEMVDFFDLPSISVPDFDKTKKIEDYYNAADYAEFNRNYHNKYDVFMKFMKDNSLEAKLNGAGK